MAGRGQWERWAEEQGRAMPAVPVRDEGPSRTAEDIGRTAADEPRLRDPRIDSLAACPSRDCGGW